MVQVEDWVFGVVFNEKKWEIVFCDVSVEQLFEYLFVDSDNMLSDVLLILFGGFVVFSECMVKLGFLGIQVGVEMKMMGFQGELFNVGFVEFFVGLLVVLQCGEVLLVVQCDLFWLLMQRV